MKRKREQAPASPYACDLWGKSFPTIHSEQIVKKASKERKRSSVERPNLKVFSFGGGVQSMAALVLAVQGIIDYRVFLFCNVGEDSENPETLRYFSEYARPYAQAHSLYLQEIRRRLKNGTPAETLYEKLTRPESRSIGIPMRMSNGAPGRRSCTADYKIRVVARWTRLEGATKHCPATVGLGISLDEFDRMRTESGIPHERLAYPLIDLGLDRAACLRIIVDAGLPEPPKSSCWFCPFHTLQVWQAMRTYQPALFWRASDLETLLNERRKRLGRDLIWLTPTSRPLAQATTDYEQGRLPETMAEMCGGYCHV